MRAAPAFPATAALAVPGVRATGRARAGLAARAARCPITGDPMKKSLLTLVALAAFALPQSPALAANPVVEMKTSQGEIVVELFADKAPKSAENFVQYVKDGHYNGTVFHRVIDGFIRAS